ncbi:MAG: hypothetical protein ABIH23_36270, partial [bacterium]
MQSFSTTSTRIVRIMLIGILIPVAAYTDTVREAGAQVARFEIPGWTPQPAKRTVWTRWLNTFDFRKGAGDPDYYRGVYFMACRPSNYRTMAEGRYGEAGAPLYTVRDKRTQMTYPMDGNCGTWQSMVELFVRSKPGMNLWNDGKEHHVLHLFGAQAARDIPDGLSVSLIKTSKGTLEYQCQGTTLSLPVACIEADQWVHIALSWDAKTSPGRLWLTIDGKGVTAQANRPLQPVSYAFLVLGNSPRDADK